jgi:DNA mismatch repair protein MutL
MTAIYPLPTEVVYRIAAGEVIDSLAAVVRELAENSLDAGATRIHVALWPERWQVCVTDNGQGMTLENLQRAAHPHSTSKIQRDEDLWQIASLGFRGEALHSLAQLGQLQIASRSAMDSNALGWQLSYTSQGEGQNLTTLALAPGTIVTVKGLFGQWPARRQALPSVAQQLRGIQLVLYRIALCHPQVIWQVVKDDRPWFTLWPGETAQALLPQILTAIESQDLAQLSLPVENADHQPLGSLYLLLGLPDRAHRRRPDWIKVALNGRVVQIAELEQTILGALRRTLPRDRFPICFLHLQINPDQIDWNRHPAKAEVYLRDLNFWQNQVCGAIEQLLRLNASHQPDTRHNQRVGQLLKAAEQGAGYLVHREITPGDQNPLELGGSLKAIAQVHNRYIVAEHPTGIWLVEQHIAHERVLYEQICERWQLEDLNPPVILSHLSIAQVEQLERLGLEVEAFGEQQWAVRQAPALLASRSDCGEALLELSLGGDLQTAQVATACRSAIRNGVSLSLEQMQELLGQWQQTRNPRTCPHGHPIYLNLEESSLSRFFRRHWVIGKSHGLE